MVKNPLIRTYPKRVSKPLPNKSAGILDDYSVRRNVATNTGTVEKTPVNDSDIANKKYVDENVGTGDVTAAINLTDIKIVQGDGGAKGVKTSNATVTQVVNSAIHTTGDGSDHADVASNTAASHAQSHTIVSHSDTTATGAELDTLTGGADTTLHDHDGISENTTHRGSDGSDHSAVVANTAKVSNVTTNLTLGVGNATTEIIVSSDGTDVTLVEADTDNAGLLGADKWDEIVAATTHVASDGSGHADVATNTTDIATNVTAIGLNTTHAADNTQAHSDYLLNSGADIAVGPLTTTADNSTADLAFLAMVLYNTDATPPTASGFPIGTIYIQYTA